MRYLNDFDDEPGNPFGEEAVSEPAPAVWDLMSTHHNPEHMSTDERAEWARQQLRRLGFTDGQASVVSGTPWLPDAAYLPADQHRAVRRDALIRMALAPHDPAMAAWVEQMTGAAIVKLRQRYGRRTARKMMRSAHPSIERIAAWAIEELHREEWI